MKQGSPLTSSINTHKTNSSVYITTNSRNYVLTYSTLYRAILHYKKSTILKNTIGKIIAFYICNIYVKKKSKGHGK